MLVRICFLAYSILVGVRGSSPFLLKEYKNHWANKNLFYETHKRDIYFCIKLFLKFNKKKNIQEKNLTKLKVNCLSMIKKHVIHLNFQIEEYMSRKR